MRALPRGFLKLYIQRTFSDAENGKARPVFFNGLRASPAVPDGKSLRKYLKTLSRNNILWFNPKK